MIVGPEMEVTSILKTLGVSLTDNVRTIIHNSAIQLN